MNVSVVGGSGFIGTRLCRRLSQAENTNFVIIDKAGSTTFPEKVMIALAIQLLSLIRNLLGVKSRFFRCKYLGLEF